MLKLNQDTTILFIQTQSSRKRSLKKLQQVYLLETSTPASFTTISMPLIKLYMMREVILTSDFSSKNATCVRWIVLKINFIFFICFLFFLNPQNPNDHHLHQHSQTPNYLPIVWCLTNNLLTSWSLILLNLNSSKKSPQSMSCLTTTINQHLQSSTFFTIWPTNLTTKFLT